MVLDYVKGKVLPAIAIASAVIALTFYVLWQSTEGDLKDTQDKLTAAEKAVTEFETSIATMKKDAEVKSDQNFKLAVTLSVLQDDYALEVKALKDKITVLESRKAKATIVVETKEYVEEAYVKEVNSTALSSMWNTYCRITKDCSKEVKK